MYVCLKEGREVTQTVLYNTNKILATKKSSFFCKVGESIFFMLLFVIFVCKTRKFCLCLVCQFFWWLLLGLRSHVIHVTCPCVNRWTTVWREWSWTPALAARFRTLINDTCALSTRTNGFFSLFLILALTIQSVPRKAFASADCVKKD